MLYEQARHTHPRRVYERARYTWHRRPSGEIWSAEGRGVMGLRAVPLTLKQANAAVGELHRHHKPVVGHRFSIGAIDGNRLVGCVIVGRPVARAVEQYRTAEVTRLATDGTKNACSFLYAAAARAADAMGYDSIQTYTLVSEPGASLRAAGWDDEGTPRPTGKGWNNRKGRRSDQPQEQKRRWRKILSNGRRALAGEKGAG